MKDIFIEDIIKNMCSKYGYTIHEINEIEDLTTNWILMNEDIFNRDILIFLKDSEVNNEELNSKIQQAINKMSEGVNYRLIKVMVIENNADELMEQYVNNGGVYNHFGETITIDKKNMHITISGEGVRQISDRVIRSIVVKNNKNIWNFKEFPVTYSLVTINIILFLISALLSSNVIEIDGGILVKLGAKVNYLIAGGQYYRLITCMFLHGGILHIGLNMYALVNIGSLIEGIYGYKKYLVIYFFSGILASFSSFYFSNVNSIGASGAIFGLLGAILVYSLSNKDKVNKSFIKNIFSVIITNLIIGMTIPNIDNFAHIGGLLGGMLAAYTISILINREH